MRFQSRERKRAVFGDWIKLLLLLAFSLYFILYFFNSMAPETSFDGSRYHLALVGRYLRDHGFHRITNNMYASLSQGVEMLYLWAFAFGQHSAAAMVHFAFLLALVWQMFGYGRRVGLPLAGACGALLVFASPVVGVDGTSAYNDVAVAAIAFTLFHLLQIWDDVRAPRLLVAIGLVAGFGYAAKYTACLGVVYALGFVAWKSRRRIRETAVVAVSSAALVAPWMVKNWIWVANPFSPFLNGLFPNPYVTVAFEQEYRHHMALYELGSRWQIPMQVTTYGSLAGLLGPVFLLAPIALLALRRREGRQLLLAALVFGATYFSNISTRFLIPPLPFVALAMALVVEPRAPCAGCGGAGARSHFLAFHGRQVLPLRCVAPDQSALARSAAHQARGPLPGIQLALVRRGPPGGADRARQDRRSSPSRLSPTPTPRATSWWRSNRLKMSRAARFCGPLSRPTTSRPGACGSRSRGSRSEPCAWSKPTAAPTCGASTNSACSTARANCRASPAGASTRNHTLGASGMRSTASSITFWKCGETIAPRPVRRSGFR